MITRLPPQNLEAKSSVLGAILLEDEAIHRVMEVVCADDFYRDSHRKIFRAMVELSGRGEPIDLLTVGDQLKESGDLESIGGIAHIASLNDVAFTTVNVAHHASMVRDAAAKRTLLSVLQEAEETIYSSGDDLLTIAGRLSSHLAKIQNGGGKGFVGISDVVVETLKRIEQAHDRGSLVTGIPTGFTRLDQGLGGIHPGELFIIAGRPSMGKTAFAGGIAEGATQHGHGVAFVTAESPSHEIVQRLMTKATGIENRNLRRGKLEDREYPVLVARSGDLGKLPIWLLHADRSWDRIQAKIRALKLREPKICLVIVDYVQLLSAPVLKGERYLEIGRISSEAKGLAIDLGIGFALLSQLNRDVENRSDNRPKLSDLRESGNLEQDADVVAVLYRESKYNDKASRDRAELIIEKNRNGDIGSIPLRFDAPTVSFHDWIDAGSNRTEGTQAT
jgi:replicative DNA helicase